MKTTLTAIAIILSITSAHADIKSVEGVSVNTPIAKYKVHSLQQNPELPVLSDNSLDGINTYVNHHLKYKKDVDDVWQIPSENEKYGDCEDFAIFKYYLAKRAGHTAKIAVGRLKDEGVDHAVVIVDDKYALMSRSDKIYSLKSFGKNFRVYYYVTDKFLTTSDGDLK